MTTTTVTKTDQRCGVGRDGAAQSDSEMLEIDSTVSHDVMTSADEPPADICRPVDVQDLDICDTELEDISKIFSQVKSLRPGEGEAFPPVISSIYVSMSSNGPDRSDIRMHSVSLSPHGSPQSQDESMRTATRFATAPFGPSRRRAPSRRARSEWRSS